MTEATVRRIIRAIEAVKASGHGQVVIEIVKGKIVLIKETEIERIAE